MSDDDERCSKIHLSLADDESVNLDVNVLEMLELFPDAQYNMTYEQLLKFKDAVKKDIPADADPSRLVTVTFSFDENPETNRFDIARVVNSKDTLVQIKQKIQENQCALAAMSPRPQTVPISPPSTIVPLPREPDKTAANSKESQTSSKTISDTLSNRTLVKKHILSINKQPKLQSDNKPGDNSIMKILHGVNPPIEVLNACAQQRSTSNQPYLDKFTKEITFQRANLFHQIDSNLRGKKTLTGPELEEFIFPTQNDFNSMLSEKKSILSVLAAQREKEATSQPSPQQLPKASTSQLPSSQTLTNPGLSIDLPPELQSNNKPDITFYQKLLENVFPPIGLLYVMTEGLDTPHQKFVDKCIEEIISDKTEIVSAHDLCEMIVLKVNDANLKKIDEMSKSRSTVPVSPPSTIVPLPREPDKTAANSKKPQTSSKTISDTLSSR